VSYRRERRDRHPPAWCAAIAYGAQRTGRSSTVGDAMTIDGGEVRVYRFGWYDAEGKVQEADSTYTDWRQAMEALGPACAGRKAAHLPQISVVLVYQLRIAAPSSFFWMTRG
jgi:hypothetical protein